MVSLHQIPSLPARRLGGQVSAHGSSRHKVRGFQNQINVIRHLTVFFLFHLRWRKELFKTYNIVLSSPPPLLIANIWWARALSQESWICYFVGLGKKFRPSPLGTNWVLVEARSWGFGLGLRCNQRTSVLTPSIFLFCCLLITYIETHYLPAEYGNNVWMSI